MFGLLDRDIDCIYKALEQFEEIERAVIFGSRAMGNYKPGSDIDLAVFGENITSQILFRLDDYLNEVYPLPYFFDVIHYEAILNDNLKIHINEEGKVIYNKNKSV